MTRLYYSLKKLGETFKLPKAILKTEMSHDDVDGDNYKDKKDIWLPYIKIDVLSTSYCYARYCVAMEKITGFSLKDCLSLPGLGFKNFNSLRTDQDEQGLCYELLFFLIFCYSVRRARLVSYAYLYTTNKVSTDWLNCC